MLARHRTLPLTVRVTVSETPRKRKHRLFCEQRSADGCCAKTRCCWTAKAVTAPICLCWRATTVCCFAVPSPTRISSSLCCAVHPRDAAMPLIAQGRYYSPAWIRVQSWFATPTRHPATVASAGVTGRYSHCAWPCDDFIASTSSHAAACTARTRLACARWPGPFFQRVNATARTGSSPTLAAICALPRLIVSRPVASSLSAAGLLTTGAVAWCRTLLFLAQACQAAGIEPILSLPELPRAGSHQPQRCTAHRGLACRWALPLLISIHANA